MEKLDLVAKRKTQNKAAEAAFVCAEAKKAIAKILGDAKAVRAISLSSGALKISISGSSCSQEIRLFEQGIREAVNAKVGREAIKKIIIGA